MIRQFTLVLALAMYVLTATCGAGTYRFESISFPQSPNTHAYAINDAGVVVGAYMDTGLNYHAFSWTSRGQYRTLDPVTPTSFTDMLIFGINSDGDVAGVVREELRNNLAIIGNVNGDLQTEPFAFNRYYEPRDITDDGRMLGYITVDDGVHESFLWRPGESPSYYDFPGLHSSRVFGINNAGVVVGIADEAERPYGFLYDPATDIVHEVAYPGATSIFLDDINDSGVAVGMGHFEDTNKESSFVRRSTGRLEIIDFPGATQTLVTGINNRGDIVGLYDGPGDFYYKGFVGWYVPEPASSSMLFVGLAAAVMFALSRKC